MCIVAVLPNTNFCESSTNKSPNPVARIFLVSQAAKFVENYTESVIFQESRVDFTVVAGFLINRSLVPRRVPLVADNQNFVNLISST